MLQLKHAQILLATKNVCKGWWQGTISWSFHACLIQNLFVFLVRAPKADSFDYAPILLDVVLDHLLTFFPWANLEQFLVQRLRDACIDCTDLFVCYFAMKWIKLCNYILKDNLFEHLSRFFGKLYIWGWLSKIFDVEFLANIVLLKGFHASRSLLLSDYWLFALFLFFENSSIILLDAIFLGYRNLNFLDLLILNLFLIIWIDDKCAFNESSCKSLRCLIGSKTFCKSIGFNFLINIKQVLIFRICVLGHKLATRLLIIVYVMVIHDSDSVSPWLIVELALHIFVIMLPCRGAYTIVNHFKSLNLVYLKNYLIFLTNSN